MKKNPMNANSSFVVPFAKFPFGNSNDFSHSCQLELEIQNLDMADTFKFLTESHSFMNIFNLTVGYLIIDFKGKILKLNRSAALVLGLTNPSVTGKEFMKLLHKDSRTTFTKHLMDCTQQKNGIQNECQISIKNFNQSIRTIKLNSVTTVDNKLNPIIKMVVVDISDQIKVRQLEAINIELTEQKLSREKIVIGLTHDLRAPLNSAKICSQLLLKKCAKEIHNPNTKKIFDIQVEQLNRADTMIRDILDTNRLHHSKDEALNLRKCDFSKIIQHQIELMQFSHSGNIKIEYSVHGRTTGMWSTETIERIFENLVSNAIKYGLKETPITVIVEGSKSTVSLCVHNFGNPIPPEEQFKIFEAFQRTSESNISSAQGWGIGLNLVNCLVQKHGGEIKLKSTEKEGTSFQVILPKKMLLR